MGGPVPLRGVVLEKKILPSFPRRAWDMRASLSTVAALVMLAPTRPQSSWSWQCGDQVVMVSKGSW